jgi:hypothetical protein
MARPSSSFVPAIRTTMGATPWSERRKAAMPSAISSMRVRPPIKLTSTTCVAGPARATRKATCMPSAFASAPSSQKLAARPPASWIVNRQHPSLRPVGDERNVPVERDMQIRSHRNSMIALDSVIVVAPHQQ